MYIRKVHIENIRSIEKLDWEVPEGKEAGWHVLIGDNGAGKSTVLRAIALALIGKDEWGGLRQHAQDWLKRGSAEGAIIVHPWFTKKEKISFGSSLSRDLFHHLFHDPYDLYAPLSEPLSISINKVSFEDSDHLLYAMGLGFSAAYGPFRRFSGGDEGSEAIFNSLPRLSAHLSVFGESYALTEALKWLRALKFKSLEHKPEGRLLEQLTAFINQLDFLPHQANLSALVHRGR